MRPLNLAMTGFVILAAGCAPSTNAVQRPQVRPRTSPPIAARRNPPPPRPRPLDTDGDGIPDSRDKCPKTPEVFNGIKDEDGCPDRTCTLPIAPARIQIAARIYFDTGVAQIPARFSAMLQKIANELKTHPEILLMEIQGHVDLTESRWRSSVGRTLGKTRADAVRSRLIRLGIAANRLIAKDYGTTAPVDTNRTVRGRARNRQVRFVVLKQR